MQAIGPAAKFYLARPYKANGCMATRQAPSVSCAAREALGPASRDRSSQGSTNGDEGGRRIQLTHRPRPAAASRSRTGTVHPSDELSTLALLDPRHFAAKDPRPKTGVVRRWVTREGRPTAAPPPQESAVQGDGAAECSDRSASGVLADMGFSRNAYSSCFRSVRAVGRRRLLMIVRSSA